MGLYRDEYAEMKINVTTIILVTKMMMARTMMMKIYFILRAGNTGHLYTEWPFSRYRR